jgi:dCMP deaminase
VALTEAIVAYVPVLHEGYRAFFARYPKAKIFVLSDELVSNFRPLIKDLRRLNPTLICRSIRAWGIDCELATPDSLKKLASDGVEIVMPDEDVSRAIAEHYFDKSKLDFAKIFLRWDRRSSDAKESIKADRTINANTATKELLLRAHALGDKSSDLWRRQGALIFKDGKVLLEAFNRSIPTGNTAWSDGDPRNNYKQGMNIETSVFLHAEAGLVAEAAGKGIAIRGADLYITTFPCPVCAKLLVAAGIKRVFFVTGYAMLDAEQLFREAGVEIVRVKINLPDNHPELWVPYPD